MLFYSMSPIDVVGSDGITPCTDSGPSGGQNDLTTRDLGDAHGEPAAVVPVITA